MIAVSDDGMGRDRRGRRASRPSIGSGPRATALGSRPLIIGHRGFPVRFQDNSLAGIEAALCLGADGVEVDIRPCAEGTWVCHHDRSRAGRQVSTWRQVELRRQGVPSLDEVVTGVPADRWLYVEVKPLALTQLAARAEELRRMLVPRAATTRLLSSSLPILEVLGRVVPGISRSWVVGEVPAGPPPAGIALSPRHTLVERLLAWKLPVHPWTVNRPERMRELGSLGVASITTNRCDVAMETLRG